MPRLNASSPACSGDYPIIESRRVFCVADVPWNLEPAKTPDAVDDRVVSFHAGASLLDPSRMALGAFCVFDPKPRAALTGREAVRLRRYADAAMASIGSSLAPTLQRARF